MIRYAGAVGFLAVFLCLNSYCCADCTFGDKSDEVYQVQVELLKLGYSVPVLNGVFDAKMAENVRLFQKRYGLPVSGVVDKDTYYALQSREHLQTGVSLRVLRLLDIATQMLKSQYAWGGENSRGFDCSGFTQYCYSCVGRYIPRTADVQYEFGKAVRRRDVRPGDMVFYTTYEPGASHCGIYIGSGKFIHVGSSTGVTIAEAFTGYWGERYYGACRVFE